MKTIFFRLALPMIILAVLVLTYSACQQEQMLEEPVSVIAEENPNNVTERGNSVAPCGTELSEEEMNYLNQTREERQAFSQKAGPQVHNIPVVNHIVRRSDGTDGLALSRLTSAMEALNATYADANIQFYELKPVNYIDSDDWYAFHHSEEEALAEGNDVPNAINIYYCVTVRNPGLVAGYTQYPPNERRIMMAYMNVEDGITLRHEMAHYFSVYHTHGPSSCGSGIPELVNGDNCENAGDEICDTPADPCLTGLVDSDCNYTGTALDDGQPPQPYNPFTDNLMSYSVHDCRENFTDGQLDRIIGGFWTYHTNLVSRITWRYRSYLGRFGICVSQYPGSLHQFRYQTCTSTGEAIGNWVERSPTTSRCFSLPANLNTCYYNVQVKIVPTNGGALWSGWSDSELVRCASDF